MSKFAWKDVWEFHAVTVQTKMADTLGTRVWDAPALSMTCQVQFLNRCWGLQLSTADDKHDTLQPYQSYLRQYKECCIHEFPEELSQFSHQDLAEFAQCLSQHSSEPYQDITEKLKSSLGQHNVDLDTLWHCTSFVGRAVLHLNLADWPKDKSLRDFVLYTIGSGSSQDDRFQLPLSFNARSFEKIAGVAIQWERDLLNHISTGHDMDSLRIFHHAIVLDLYEKSKFNSIFPEHFLDETRETLALLLPPNDRASRKWFKKEQQKYHLDSVAGDCPALRREHRNIQRFNFWRDRLIIAKEVFDTSQPGSLIQFWRDDRNPVQWWTFWIAGVVFILTWIGVIEGALQVYKAYHPTT